MENLLKSGYICNPQQAYTLRKVTVSDGKAKGTTVIEVCTAAGLQVDILPDAGLDIGQVRFKGINMCYISKNGFDSPATALPINGEFGKFFPGGMLYTCGLRSTGGGNQDGNEFHPTHGRYHCLQADQLGAYVEDDTIIVRGIIRETALFGHVLQMQRIIRIPIFGSTITVSDKISNHTCKDEEYALLYHCNFGYPLISEKAHLELPADRKTSPRTPFAATGMGKECTFDAPVPGQEERVFFHENMEHRAALVNESIGVKMQVTWSENLPVLAHWRSMASGDYVCGLEPTNCYIMGRSKERENGTLPVLKAFESIETQVCFQFEAI